MTFDNLNSLGKDKTPFLFISDFQAKDIKLIPLAELSKHDIEFSIEENFKKKEHENFFELYPLPFQEYNNKFNHIIKKIRSGDTYLLNLTQPTEIKTTLNLKEIYSYANAPYKLRYKDKFVCFSPEKFISIEHNTINTYPMKGTIDASIDGAKDKILNNKKELAEHIMIVDMLRNDLSIVAKNVKVDKFRYVDTIEAGNKKLLQISSHISGDLTDSWHEHIGDILKSLLPAGSISGTPKKSTIEIIENVEKYSRGFFTGIFGVYNGVSFNSAVMIRYVEKIGDNFVYKSGGGITFDSDAKEEYNELLDKVYLP